MESDYHRKSTHCKTFLFTGLALAAVFSILVGNIGVGLIMGLSLSFLTGIIYKRLMLVSA